MKSMGICLNMKCVSSESPDLMIDSISFRYHKEGALFAQNRIDFLFPFMLCNSTWNIYCVFASYSLGNKLNVTLCTLLLVITKELQSKKNKKHAKTSLSNYQDRTHFRVCHSKNKRTPGKVVTHSPLVSWLWQYVCQIFATPWQDALIFACHRLESSTDL